MKIAETPQEQAWLGFRAAMAYLGVTEWTFRGLVRDGKVTRRQIGAEHAKYLRSDLDALSERSTRRATLPELDPTPAA